MNFWFSLPTQGVDSRWRRSAQQQRGWGPFGYLAGEGGRGGATKAIDATRTTTREPQPRVRQPPYGMNGSNTIVRSAFRRASMPPQRRHRGLHVTPLPSPGRAPVILPPYIVLYFAEAGADHRSTGTQNLGSLHGTCLKIIPSRRIRRLLACLEWCRLMRWPSCGLAFMSAIITASAWYR